MWKKNNRGQWKQGKIQKSLLSILGSFLLVALLGFAWTQVYRQYQNLSRKPSKEESQVQEITENNVKRELEIPKEKIISVPYTVQAPLANWNIHDESCEEAALLMYHYFLNGRTTFDGQTVIPKNTANIDEIKMKEWQINNYGVEPDLSIEAWGKFAKEYYGYNYQVYTEITKEDIKREIAKSNPVIIPVITHALENPYYGREPSYHVVLIKGYKEEGVITNDPGVKEGENYFYTWDIVFKAIDAQTPKMKQGRVMATLSK